MNFAELGAVTAILVGTMAGAAAAHDHQAGWSVALFAAGGLAIGTGFAFAGTKLAYAALRRSTRPQGERETAGSMAFTILYILTPILAICAAGATAAWLTALVLGR